MRLPPSPPAAPTELTPTATGSCARRSVNWRGGVKASVDVAAGDVISCAGKGRLVVSEVAKTAKGKYVVQLTRYV